MSASDTPNRSNFNIKDTNANKNLHFGELVPGAYTLRVTIEDVCEPYLMQLGLLQRTPKGRMVSAEAYKVVGLPAQDEPSEDPDGEEQLRLI